MPSFKNGMSTTPGIARPYRFSDDNGMKVFREDTTPWFAHGKVDRGWMYSQWSLGQVHCGDDHNAE